jgi:hypothetical protein
MSRLPHRIHHGQPHRLHPQPAPRPRIYQHLHRLTLAANRILQRLLHPHMIKFSICQYRKIPQQ